jgi:hypothetical protein
MTTTFGKRQKDDKAAALGSSAGGDIPARYWIPVAIIAVILIVGLVLLRL